MPAKSLLVRADASAEIGVGHVMRCVALGEAWQKTGGRAIFALAAGADELEGRIRSHGWEVARIEANPGSREDAILTSEVANSLGTEWLILDGYHFSSDYMESLVERVPSRFLLMADGEEVSECECDIVVNPEPEAAEVAWPGSSRKTEFLLGPRYAILRREFLDFNTQPRITPGKAQCILVTFGGGDSHNVTLKVVQALQSVTDLKLDLTVVLGPSNPHRGSLQKAVEKSRHAVRLLSNVGNMPELMSRADLAITAGGGTCYELAFMRVPMFLITIAKSQERPAKAYSSSNAAFVAGSFDSLDGLALSRLLEGFIGNRSLRGEFAENARRLIDGKGAQRIVERMFAVSARSNEGTEPQS